MTTLDDFLIEHELLSFESKFEREIKEKEFQNKFEKSYTKKQLEKLRELSKTS